MKISEESNNNIVAILLSCAHDLNGTSPAGSRMDGGKYSKECIQECLHEIEKRIGNDQALKNDPQLQPLITALGTVHNVSDSRQVAKAVGHLPIPNYIKQDPPSIPPNPFKR